ncbi:MAG: transporter [Bacteroidota bacterium]
MNRTFLPVLGMILLCLNTALAQDNLWTANRPDGHAPIGVMGDHTHSKGELMISYRYMRMNMDGMRNENDALTSEQVLQDFGFTVTPVSMPMNMHMLGAMYAVSDQLTLMTMVNIVSISMDHTSRPGINFTTETSGLGDIRLGGLYKFFDKNHQRMHFNFSVNIPTGSIDETDVTPLPMEAERQLPYPMQLGSGTFDVLPGVTYVNEIGNYSMGAQLSGNIRLTESSRDYRLGHQFAATYWSAYKLTDFLSLSGRFSYTAQGAIEGADTELGQVNPMNNALSTVPTAFPENFGGSQLFFGGGLNVYIAEGPLKNIRIAGEMQWPLLRHLNGPQMETDDILTLGIQYSF